MSQAGRPASRGLWTGRHLVWGGLRGRSSLNPPPRQILPSADVSWHHRASRRAAIAHQRTSRWGPLGSTLGPCPKHGIPHWKATNVGRLNCLVVGKVTEPLTTLGWRSSTPRGTFLARWTASPRLKLQNTLPAENSSPTFNGGAHCGDIAQAHDVSALGTRSTVDVWALLRLTDKINPFGTSLVFQRIQRRIQVRCQPAHPPTGATVKRPLGTLPNGAPWRPRPRPIWTLGRPAMVELSSQRYDLTGEALQAQWTPAMAMSHHNGWRMEASVAASARARTAEGTASDAAYSAPFHAQNGCPGSESRKTLAPSCRCSPKRARATATPPILRPCRLKTDRTRRPRLSERARSSKWSASSAWTCVYRQNVENPIVEQVDSLGSRRLSTPMRRCKCRASRHVPNGKTHHALSVPPRGSITF